MSTFEIGLALTIIILVFDLAMTGWFSVALTKLNEPALRSVTWGYGLTFHLIILLGFWVSTLAVNRFGKPAYDDVLAGIGVIATIFLLLSGYLIMSSAADEREIRMR